MPNQFPSNQPTTFATFLLVGVLAFTNGCGGSEKTTSPPAAGADSNQKSASAEGTRSGGERSGGGRGGAGGARRGGRGGGAGQKQVVEVISAQRRDLKETLTVVGSLAANESADIRPEVAGLVREILFEEGQRVTNGQVLLRIDDSELRAQYAQVDARYRLAELNVTRTESLNQSQAISQAETDRVRSEFAGTKAELALLKSRLEKTEVKAPFDGFAGSRSISPGDFVNQSTPITTINDVSKLKVEFQVPERYLGKIQHGTPFLIRSRAMDASQVIQGEVYFVSSVIERSTRSSEVKGFLDKPLAVLKPGMFANIEVVLDVRKAALTVPEGSILITAGGGSQVIAVREENGESIADFVPVELGLRVRGVVEVTAAKGGLEENQLVVASGVGALLLRQGMRLDTRPLREEFRIEN